MLGIKPEALDFYKMPYVIHPPDKQRISFGRAKVLKPAHEVFMAKKDGALLSVKYRMLNSKGNYSNILSQLYLFYTEILNKTVI